MRSELQVRTSDRLAAVMALPTSPPRRPPGAAQTRLPFAVPHHPAPHPARPQRCRQGPGDPGATPPARRAAAPGSSTQVRADRPCRACRPQQGAATGTLVVLHRQTRDAAALASPPGRSRVDISPSWTWASATRRGRAAADRPPGTGESALGLPAHPRRAAPAWDPGLGNRDPRNAAPAWLGPCATAGIDDVAGVSSPAGHWDPRLRLLHRRHRLAATALCAVLYRTGHPARPPGRGHCQPERRLGCSAGTQPAAGTRRAGATCSVCPAGSGCQVLPRL